MRIKPIVYLSASAYLSVILYLLTFNPDPHHDGILLSAGYMTQRGLVPHLDYVFIWGPVLPYILAIPLFITKNLIALRFFGYICICAVAYLLYKLNAKGLSKRDSIFISAIWLISLPPITILTTNPWPRSINAWPNIYGFLFILISAYMLINTLPNLNGVNSYLLHFIAGVFAVLPVFIRFDFIFCLLALIFYKYWLSNSKKLFLTFMLPTFIIFSILLFNRSNRFVDAWFQQTFLALKGPQASSGVPDFTFMATARSLLAIILLFSLYIIFVVLMQNINNFYRKKYKYIIVAFYILYVTICILYNLEIIKSYPINKISLWFNRINTEFSLGYISVALFALIPVTIINFRNNNLKKNTDPYLSLLALLSFASLPLNHNMNVEYIWLNCIFLISYSLLSINKIFKISFFNLLFPSFIFSTLMFIFGAINLSQAQVYNYESVPLKYMHSVDKQYGIDLDREMVLFENVPIGSKFQNMCNDWIYLVNDRNVIYSSKLLTLNENPIFGKNYNIKSGTWIFECNVSEKRLSELSNFKLYHIKKENGTISLIYKFVL